MIGAMISTAFSGRRSVLLGTRGLMANRATSAGKCRLGTEVLSGNLKVDVRGRLQDKIMFGSDYPGMPEDLRSEHRENPGPVSGAALLQTRI
jgi:hypothetical protein